MEPVEIWSFAADVPAERRRRQVGRAVAMLVSVGAVVLGWTLVGPIGGFVGVALLLAVAVLGTWWVRDVVDAEFVAVSVRGDHPAARELTVHGATGWTRAAGAEAFEADDADNADTRVVVVPVGTATQVSVYPSVTMGDRDVGGAGFHLVVDVRDGDGSCRVAAFDRRIAFRIPGERALAEAVAAMFDDVWVDEPEDPFGEFDRVRWRDWWA